MKRFHLPTFGELLRHLLLSWLIGALLQYLLVPADAKVLGTLGAVSAMSFPLLLCEMALGMVLLYLLSCFFDICKWERYAMAGGFLLLAAASLLYNASLPLLIFCLIILAALVVYAIFGHKAEDIKAISASHWAYPVVLGVLTLGLCGFLCAWTVCRYLSFYTPDYDFGIFAQMFHNMRTTGLPMTTVERQGLLSHFAVHVSPIYYLMLPAYCLFPDPVTLQLLQVLVICSAVIPLWLIGKHHGLSGSFRLLSCTLLLLFPAVGGGIYYDLHENCFLLPLVLWLLYAMDKKSTWLIALFTFLTLMVKEDAGVYTAVAGLYLIFRTGLNRGSRKDRSTGLIMVLASVCYFLLVTNYLAASGDGVMTYRYQNFMQGQDGSLLSVIVTVLLCPMKMLYECVDPEKLTYILQTMLPLLGLPLLTRKFERYLLLIPYLLINLMSDYQYQHDIFFQYNFGSTAFLLYLTAVNLADLKGFVPRLIPLSLTVAVSAVFFCNTVVPKAWDTIQAYQQYEGYYDLVRENLDLIPDDASVSCTTYYVAYLSKRSVLYDVKYSPIEQLLTTEYIAVNKNSDTNFTNYGDFEAFAAILDENGYEIVNDHPSILIYHKSRS